MLARHKKAVINDMTAQLVICIVFYLKIEKVRNSVESKEAIRDTTVICVLIEGPAVSLNGSPTVSPTTADLWASEPLPPSCPDSTYFFALSHKPPALDMNQARRRPLTMFPTRKPAIADTPPTIPTTIVETIATAPAGISSLIAPSAAISIQRL